MPTRPDALTRFRDGYGEVPRPVPSYVLSRTLAAGVAESMTIPTVNGRLAEYVIFSADNTFYANMFTTAAVASDVTDGTASEMNPAGYAIPPDCTTISVISPGACNITASFYRGHGG